MILKNLIPLKINTDKKGVSCVTFAKGTKKLEHVGVVIFDKGYHFPLNQRVDLTITKPTK